VVIRPSGREPGREARLLLPGAAVPSTWAYVGIANPGGAPRALDSKVVVRGVGVARVIVSFLPSYGGSGSPYMMMVACSMSASGLGSSVARGSSGGL
jgi:hypothetical protein